MRGRRGSYVFRTFPATRCRIYAGAGPEDRPPQRSVGFALRGSSNRNRYTLAIGFDLCKPFGGAAESRGGCMRGVQTWSPPGNARSDVEARLDSSAMTGEGDQANLNPSRKVQPTGGHQQTVVKSTSTATSTADGDKKRIRGFPEMPRDSNLIQTRRLLSSTLTGSRLAASQKNSRACSNVPSCSQLSLPSCRRSFLL